MLFQGCAGLGALKGAQTRQGLSTAIPLFFAKFHTCNSQILFILKNSINTISFSASYLDLPPADDASKIYCVCEKALAGLRPLQDA